MTDNPGQAPEAPEEEVTQNTPDLGTSPDLDTPIIEQTSEAGDLAKYMSEMKRARKEAARYRTERNALQNDMQTKVDNLQTQLQNLQDEAAAAIQGQLDELRLELTREQEARQQLEFEALRNQVASDFGIPNELADRLRGDDETALREDAERLKDVLAHKGTGPAPKPGVGSPPPQVSKAKQIYDRAKRGGGGELFDPETHKRLGGGIVTE